MRIGDWSSDVCSSDLFHIGALQYSITAGPCAALQRHVVDADVTARTIDPATTQAQVVHVGVDVDLAVQTHFIKGDAIATCCRITSPDSFLSEQDRKRVV